MNSTNFLADLKESMTEKPPERFTVKTISKIEQIEIDEKDVSTGKETSVVLAIMKWFATIFMFILTMFTLVASKVTVISIGQNMRPVNINGNNTECKGEECRSDIAFTMMICILVIPNVITFARTFFNSAFSSSEFWPSCKSVVFVSIYIFFINISKTCTV